jgi:hypothetical protein
MDDGIMILESEEEYILHEKSLYRNFYRNYPAYSLKFFTIVDKNRLRPNIPYNAQKIFALKHAGMLNCVASFTINPEVTFEVEDMGFSIPKSTSVCEGLHFYSRFAETMNLEAYKKLFTFALSYLLNSNFKTMYSSCSEKLIRFYTAVGFDIVDKIVFEGEVEYLTKFDITADFENKFMDTSRIKL